MKTSITSFRIMLTERKEIGVMLFFKPVTINGRILKCYFTTDWNLVSKFRLGIGSEIELIMKFGNLAGIANGIIGTAKAEIRLPEICPICGYSSMGPVSNSRLTCVNENCGYANMMRMWKVLKYCYYLTSLKFNTIHGLYTSFGIHNFTDLYRIREKLTPDEINSYSEYASIAKVLDTKPVVRLSNLYYSLIPDIMPSSAVRLSKCVTHNWKFGVSDINTIDGEEVDDERVGKLYKHASELKLYLISPDTKPEVKLLDEHLDIKEINKPTMVTGKVFKAIKTNNITTIELANLIKLAGGKYDRNASTRRGDTSIDYWVYSDKQTLEDSTEKHKYIHEDELLKILTCKD